MGPVNLAVPGQVTSVTNPDGPFAYNPRCVKRSLTDQSNKDYANATSVLSLIKNNDNVWDFQTEMQGPSGSLGVQYVIRTPLLRPVPDIFSQASLNIDITHKILR
jgi:tyrosinase